MAESIYMGSKGIFFALETTEGTYVAPGASAFILTEDASYTPVVRKSDTVNIDTIDNSLVSKEMIASKSAQFSFKVPLSWPAVAPAAAAGFLPISPLLEVCGAVSPVYAAGPPPTLSYTEQLGMDALKSGSLSYRTKRATATQIEKKSSGIRGVVGFDWEIEKIPRFNFALTGGFQSLVSSAKLDPTPGAQLTNLADAAQPAAVSLATLGGKALCLTKFSANNLFRLKVEWKLFSCGERAQPSNEPSSDITATCKMPNIDTEFNPDAYVGGEYPLVLKLAQIGGARTLSFSYPTVQVLDWKPVELGSEMGIEMTLRQTSKLTMTTE